MDNFNGSLESWMRGEIPPRVHRLLKSLNKGIYEHKMLTETKKLIIGVSGGKDSLVLAILFALYNRFYPQKLEIEAVQIDWIEHPMTETHVQSFQKLFSLLETPYTILKESINFFAKERSFNCYSCSRTRRKILFEYAEKREFQTIAFGHHLDDFVETSLMNLIHRGNFAPLKPVSSFWEDKFRIIRPMVLIPEKKITDLSHLLQLPILVIDCPYKEKNIRNQIKPLISTIEAMEPLFKKHIYQAFFKK